MRLELTIERWELNQPFTTADGSCSHIDTLLVTLRDGQRRGRGEAAGVDYRGETVHTLRDQLEAVRADIEQGIDRPAAQDLLPAGGARNALDCALWDLAAKADACRAWELAELTVRPVDTLYTVGLDRPEAMATDAARHAQFPTLKLKAGQGDPLAQVAAVRAAVPAAALVIDVNQGWSLAELVRYAPELANMGVAMIEQPLPVCDDESLRGYAGPVPLCADESCQVSGDLERLAGLYAMVNIKLDKTGGLTEALQLARRARALGFELMVGNMLGTSLAMAPAFVIAQQCRYVDLDGPLLQRADREPPMVYEHATLMPPSPMLWG